MNSTAITNDSSDIFYNDSTKNSKANSKRDNLTKLKDNIKSSSHNVSQTFSDQFIQKSKMLPKH